MKLGSSQSHTPEAMDETRCIVAGYCIDGSGADARRNVCLIIQDGIVTAMGPAAVLPRPAGAMMDDFSHCTLVPVLIDCSVSLLRSPSTGTEMRISSAKQGVEEMAAMFARHARYCHAHGVLGVAASDDMTGLKKRYQPEVAQGDLLAIRTSGGLCRTNQDCAANSPSAGDFLKVGYSGDIEAEDAFVPGMSQEDLCRLLLRYRGVKKVVVANGRQAVTEALAAGCDAIEQGYLMGEDNLNKMAALGVLWIPGALRSKNALDSSGSGGDVCCRFSQRYVAPGKPIPGAEAYWKKMLAGQMAQLRFARKAGVTTAVGTGAGSTGILHGEAVVEEMKLFIKSGYSLEEAIRCATENGARFFDFEQLGALAAGRPATFLVTRGTPRQLPRKLSYLEGIYVDGKPSGAYRKNPVKAVKE